MSRRIHSEFGTLGDRIHATADRPVMDTAAQSPAPDADVAEGPGLDGAPGVVEPLPDVLGITRDEVRWVEPAHVWVDQSHAGLLLGWARPGEGWLARVVWVAPGAGEVVVDWLTQDRVAPRR